MRFHTESYMDASEISQPLTVFLEWVNTLIPKDKYNIFLSLFKFPTPIIQTTNTIYTELEKVFEGRNPISNFEFTDSEYKDDWKKYRKANLKEPLVWRKKGWDSVKTSINSILVVDLPAEQSSELPEPYFYWLGIENVIDFKLKNSTEFEYIIFNQCDGKIAVFDEQMYRVFEVNSNGKLNEMPIVETEHELGYCPARFFWSTELVQSNCAIKKSPLSPQLANLDWLLYYETSKKHLDLYASYPIYSVYESDCDFANSETDDYCDGGFLRDKNNNYKVQRDGMLEKCPVCASKNLVGAGSLVEVPIPTGDDKDLRDPVTITTIDKASLEYNVSEVNRLKAEITSSVIGLGGDIQQKQSLNEMQVSASFESKTNVLNSIKRNLEAAQKFVDDTVCKLRYKDDFLGSDISMGTEYYIFTKNDLYAQYKLAKENGASEGELDAINQSILETEYRNNPTQLQRMIILKQLEPYRHYTQSEILDLKRENLLDDELLRIKINFTTFVDRFERENANILEFGSSIDYSKKIDIINQTFKDYAREQRGTKPEPTSNESGSGDTEES